ncbi:hypothetical protein I4U23_010673 [Adineta vaga]|nr:hypothetical protein I4U23_010673 [Adineta vaga]
MDYLVKDTVMKGSNLHTLPVELIYRVLDHLDMQTILLSTYDVCIRMNTIIDTYQPYKLDNFFSYLLNIHYLYLIQTLIELDLGGNDIGDRGALSLSNALHNNNTLKILAIDRNGISRSMKIDFKSTLTIIPRTIHFENGEYITSDRKRFGSTQTSFPWEENQNHTHDYGTRCFF